MPGPPVTGEELMRRARIAVRPALEAIGADLAGKAQREAPVAEGTLRGSATHKVSMEGGKPNVTVSFNMPYAARQHEELGYKHPKGGKAKYLSDPLKASSERYQRIIAASIKRGIKNG